MGQDVHQIEAQNKVMQVTRNNQKMLHSEIETLLNCLRVPAYILEVLKNEQLDVIDGIKNFNCLKGVKECEKAIDKIMSVIRHNFGAQDGLISVKERLEHLQKVSNEFAIRLCEFLEQFFQHHADLFLKDKSRANQRNALKLYGHEMLDQKLFKYKYLVGWLKEINARKHYELQIAYVTFLCPAYTKELQEFLDQIKSSINRNASIQGDIEFLFSSKPTDLGAAATNAIKIAIKAGKDGGERFGMKQKLMGKGKKDPLVREKDDSGGEVDEDDNLMAPDDVYKRNK